jgi:hypothetical protein
VRVLDITVTKPHKAALIRIATNMVRADTFAIRVATGKVARQRISDRKCAPQLIIRSQILGPKFKI